MKCGVCKVGETHPGTTTVTLERGDTTLIFKCVPAQVCGNCGEAYVDEEVSRRLIKIAEEAALSGVRIDIREFAPTPS